MARNVIADACYPPSFSPKVGIQLFASPPRYLLSGISRACSFPCSAALRHHFLAVLMVLYTLFGLWLLSTPAIG